jgi:RNA polymerase sigma factor (sigma-70 family)
MDLDSLLDRWRGPLVGLLAAWGTPWSEAQGLAQEVFTRAWLARGHFVGEIDDDARVGAWLRGIARNVAREVARRAPPSRGEPIELDGLPARDTREPDPRLDALRAALQRLPLEQREVLYMRYLEGTPVRAIAALLGVPERSVEGRLYRARQELRRRIQRTYQGERT